VIVVVASRFDTEAAGLVARWEPQGAALLSADDLSTEGWRWRLDRIPGSRAVVAGRRVFTRDIRGVLTRRPAVVAEELEQIRPADRTYVAAEMTAFLLAWLHGLECPVLNPPSAGNLAGPAWGQADWMRLATRLDIPVEPMTLRVPALKERSATGPESIMVTVIGQRCFGSDDPRLRRRARSLAKAAGVGLLGVRFTQPEGDLRRVTLFPSLADPSFDGPLLAGLAA
jgi:hypothetical protein